MKSGKFRSFRAACKAHFFQSRSFPLSPPFLFPFIDGVPYANASKVAVDTDSAPALGRDLARAIRVYLETLEK